jgi:hypothetical protein
MIAITTMNKYTYLQFNVVSPESSRYPDLSKFRITADRINAICGLQQHYYHYFIRYLILHPMQFTQTSYDAQFFP